jgi:Glycosyltransferase
MIPKSIARQVLLVGPDYRGHRGGIGALLSVHKELYEEFNFIPSHRPYGSRMAKLLFFVWQYARLFFFLLFNRQIKLVHIHSSKDGSFYRKFLIGCMVKLVFRKKTINHIHSGNYKRFYDNSNPINKKMIRFFLKMHDVTITVSECWRDYFQSAFQLKNVHKINNTVAAHGMSHFYKTYAKKELICFLYLGLIHPNKGIFDLLQVLGDHKPELASRIKLYIGGNGQTTQLSEIIQKAGLGDMVEFKGWVTGPEKDKLLQSSDVFVLPSYYEGSPVALLEAMSYGKPVISTIVGGIPEVVHSGFNGWLSCPGDHTGLLNALLYYVNDPENIKMHGARSLLMARDYYPQAIEPRLKSVYSSLL